MKSWSYVAGRYGYTVVAEEHEGRNIILRWWDPALQGGRGNWRRKSIRTRDRARAERAADDKALELKRGESVVPSNGITIKALLDEYLKYRTPEKSERVQDADRRKAELLIHAFGAHTLAESLTVRQWKDFQSKRLSGAIDGRGKAVPREERTPRRPRIVVDELVFLKAVFNWATAWTGSEGRFLIETNPLASKRFSIPEDQNPRGEEMTEDRYRKLLKAAQGMTIEVKWAGPREPHPSYLPEILIILNGTGRRLSAVLKLTAGDVVKTRTNEYPHGAIRWPSDTDKAGKRWECPISAEVRAAIERRLKERPSVGGAPLFPAPGNPARPVSRQSVDAWVRGAEVKAGLPSQDGTLLHALRRKFATECQHLPAQLVMNLMGIRRVETYQRYIRRRPLGLYAALEDRRELRELKESRA